MRRNWKTTCCLFMTAAFLTIGDFGSTAVWAAQMSVPSGTAVEAGTEVITEVGTETETETVTEVEKDAGNEAVTEAGTEAETETETIGKGEIETEIEIETETETETEAPTIMNAESFAIPLPQIWNADIGTTASVTGNYGSFWRDGKAPAAFPSGGFHASGSVSATNFQLAVEKTADNEDVIHCTSMNKTLRVDIMKKNITVDYSKEYYLRAWVNGKDISGTGFYMRAQVGAAGNKALTPEGGRFKDSTNEWKPYEVKLTNLAAIAGDTSNNMTVEVFFEEFTGEIWVKDIEIVEAVSLKLDKTTVNLESGDTQQLTVTTNSGAAVDPAEISWKSSDEEVAAVSASGEITAVTGGTAQITVSCEGFPDLTCWVLVDAIPLPLVWSAEIGTTGTVTDPKYAPYWAGGLAPVSFTDYWDGGKPRGDLQFTVEQLDGEDVIHCTSGSNTSRLVLTADNNPAKDPNGFTIDYSKEYYMRAWVKTKNVSAAATAGFNMRAQVGNDANQVVGNKTGGEGELPYIRDTQGQWVLCEKKLTDLAAEAAKKPGVNPPQPHDRMKFDISFQLFAGEYWVKDIELVEANVSLTLDKEIVKLDLRGTQQLKAATTGLEPMDVDAKELSWTSSNEAVATVSADGIVTAVKGGTAKISVSYAGGPKTICRVQVNDPKLDAAYAAMRGKWTERLTGNSFYNGGNMSAEYQTIVNSYNDAAAAALTTFSDNPFNKLFSDLDLTLKEGSSSTNTNDSVNLATATERVLNMARAWACEGSTYYQDTNLEAKILYAFDWIHTNIYNENFDYTKRYGNWFHWWISMPQNLGSAGILMYDVLNMPENIQILEDLNATLLHFNEDPLQVWKVFGAVKPGAAEEDKILKMTGANLADTGLVAVMRSILSQDQEGVTIASENFDKMVLMVTSGEGIYADGSFIQHTNLAYTGGYGAALLDGTEKIIYLTMDSTWEIPPEMRGIIYDWIWKGIRPLYADGAVFEMVSQRSVARPGRSDLTTGRGIMASVALISKNAPDDMKRKIQSFAKKQMIAGVDAIGRDEYFSSMSAAAMKEAVSIVEDSTIPVEATVPYAWIYGGMDKAVAHSSQFDIGISYASGRTGRFEYGNEENSKGWHQSDGMLSIYNGDMNQYSDNYWNTVDPNRLPGITTDQSTWALTNWGNYPGNANYNGGAVLDQYAAIGMNFKNYSTATNASLTAKKTWFVFDDEIVCLGAGISGINSGRDTETIVENKKVENQNALTINGVPYSTADTVSSTESDVSWAWLAGNTGKDAMGYYFPSGSDVFVKREERTGSFRDLNNGNTAVDHTPATRNYVSLAIKHGEYTGGTTSSFKYENYDYVLLPSKNSAEVEAYSKNPDIEILANDAYVQAVYDQKADVSSYVFWEKSSASNKSLRVGDVESDYATVVMKRNTAENSVSLAIADPLQNRDKVTVRLYGNGLKVLNADSNITITQTDKYGVVMDVATKNTKGASFYISFSYEEQTEETLNQYKMIRDTYANGLTGNDFADRGDAEYGNIMNTYTTNAQTAWDSLVKTEGRTTLWADLDLTLYYNGKGSNNNDSVPFETALDRVRNMALAYASEGSSLYHNEQLGADIKSALQFVLDHYPWELADKVYGNWWTWDIGVPQKLCDITLLLYEDLDDEMLHRLYRYLDTLVPFATHDWRRYDRPVLQKETGTANIMDLGVTRALTGAIGNDAKALFMASDALPELMKYVTSGSGFYADGSYKDHGTLAYTGGYGADAIRGVAKIATLTNGTPWACTDVDPNMVYEWILNAYRPLYADGAVFEMVTGRQISRYTRNDITTARYIMDAILALADSAPEEYRDRILSFAKTQTALGVAFDKDAYFGRLRFSSLIMAKKLLADDSIPLDREVYTKIYGQMDKVAVHGDGYALGISMYSNRSGNVEYGNNENSKGWYTSDGMTILYNGDQTQYNDNYWPTVDMKRLPGITTNHVTGNLPSFNDHLSPNSWVGGSMSGTQLASVGMDFTAEFSDLDAKKSWFIFGDQIVALGAGITTTQGDFAETIVENRKIDNNNILLADGFETVPAAGDQTTQEIEWAWLSSNQQGEAIGYYFPGSTDVTMERIDRTGRWYDSNTAANMTNEITQTPVTRSYMTLSLSHGVQPTGGSYSYVLLPGKSAEQMEDYAENNGIEILSNTDALQAVRDTELDVSGYNFFRAGTFTPETGSDAVKVEAMQSASITVSKENGVITIGISDPTQESGSVTVELALDTANLKVMKKDDRITADTSGEGILSLTVNTGKAYGASYTITLAEKALAEALELLKEAEDMLGIGFNTEDADSASEMYHKLKSLDLSVLSSADKTRAEVLLVGFEAAIADIAAANNAAEPFTSITEVNAANADAVNLLLAAYDNLSEAQKVMLTESQKAGVEAVRGKLKDYLNSLKKGNEEIIRDAIDNLDKVASGTQEEKEKTVRKAIESVLKLTNITLTNMDSLAELEEKIRELTGAAVEIISPDAQVLVKNAIYSVGMGKFGKIIVEKVGGFNPPAEYKLAGGAAIFDFKLLVDENVQQLLMPVYITMKIPETVDISKDIIVLHIEDDGIITEVSSSVSGDCIGFMASAFSVYVIANKAIEDDNGNSGGNDNGGENNSGGNGNTGDNTNGGEGGAHNSGGNNSGYQGPGSKQEALESRKSPKTYDTSNYVAEANGRTDQSVTDAGPETLASVSGASRNPATELMAALLLLVICASVLKKRIPKN